MRYIFLLSLLALQQVQAGVITAWTLSGPVSGSVTPFTFAANNDNVAGPSNNIVFGSLSVTSMATSLLLPIGTPSGGTTEYAVYFGVFNNTGQAWGGMLMEIWNAAGPVTTNGFDFDFPDFDSPVNSPVWALTLQNAGQLKFEGADVANGQQVNLTFNIDYPDPGNGAFMRMTPLAGVPEPSTVGAAAIGLSLLAWRRLRRR